MCLAVRTSTAKPWPTSNVVIHASPGGGAEAPIQNAGAISARPLARHGTPRGASIQAAPASAAITVQSGGMCCCQSAPGSVAHAPRNSSCHCTSHVESWSCASTGKSAASRASGVITAETSGIASALASGPATEIWPKSSSAAGARPMVIAHCTRAHCASFDPGSVQPTAA